MKDIQDSYCAAVADYIKKYISDNEIDLADLAAAANVDRKQVYRLINKENVPLLSTVVKIALAAGLELNITNMDFDFDQYRKNNNILVAVPKDKSKKS
ncbi:helix-turn-helix domain-containing protein [Chryseobacterium sp.]|uniref:helix-turn-helix domain-containing protein n=1 Tax=Chryseobacterium sp. TaxID=1871047 RepID=UPI002612749A|nr:helix-turn-helix domain-containing protein [Chryseobacterium sp.]